MVLWPTRSKWKVQVFGRAAQPVRRYRRRLPAAGPGRSLTYGSLCAWHAMPARPGADGVNSLAQAGQLLALKAVQEGRSWVTDKVRALQANRCDCHLSLSPRQNTFAIQSALCAARNWEGGRCPVLGIHCLGKAAAQGVPPSHRLHADRRRFGIKSRPCHCGPEAVGLTR